jgi:hypothetical protein
MTKDDLRKSVYGHLKAWKDLIGKPSQSFSVDDVFEPNLAHKIKVGVAEAGGNPDSLYVQSIDFTETNQLDNPMDIKFSLCYSGADK